jgi:D-alanine--poly(phosphoribitol) ligase subunit 1
MFTSGSTGDPKGVQIGKEGLSLFANWATEHLELEGAPRVMDHVLFSFDFSIFTLSASLGKGGACVMCSRDMVADKGRFIAYLIESEISVWASTPSFIRQQLLHPSFDHHHIPTLKFFYMGAEPLFPGLVEEIVSKFPDARIINGYGPTEATVSTTWLEVDTTVIKVDRGPYSIGIPKPYATVFLDNGEICIAGDHVMRGYVNRPDLNDGRLFLHNGKRAYRSGDMGYFDEQNMLHFKGRIDDQIKMHGYRIELTDVDAALTLLAGVRAGATIAIKRPDGMVLRMVGFVEPLDATPSDGIQQLPCALEDWRQMLGQHIPDYMMPVELFALSSFPTSNTGKVDRKKLTALYLEPRIQVPQESLQS